MLPLSGFTITFNRSTDYLKLAFVLFISAFFAVVRSDFSVLIQCILCIFLFVVWKHVWRNPTGQALYKKLTYHHQYWLLHPVVGAPIKYHRVDVRINGGFFVLLQLSCNQDEKTKVRDVRDRESKNINLVLFLDQITTTQFRTLKLIGKAS